MDTGKGLGRRIIWSKHKGKQVMGTIHIDTDGLADRCRQCLRRAGSESGLTPDHMLRFRYRCSDCCNTGPWDLDPYLAAIAWNLEQRLWRLREVPASRDSD